MQLVHQPMIPCHLLLININSIFATKAWYYILKYTYIVYKCRHCRVILITMCCNNYVSWTRTNLANTDCLAWLAQQIFRTFIYMYYTKNYLFRGFFLSKCCGFSSLIIFGHNDEDFICAHNFVSQAISFVRSSI